MRNRVVISGYRYYSTSLGRFINRDPAVEQGFSVLSNIVDQGDEKSLYNLAANNPINLFDILGLDWKIERNQRTKAKAETCGDTVADLANIIGLNVSDYKKWLNSDDGKPLPISSTKKLGSRKFLIPNTVYAYWAGDLGKAGKVWVRWNSSISYLEKLGFKVYSTNHHAGKKLALQSILSSGANMKILHGLYFWGHGYAPYPSVGLTNSDGEPMLYYSRINLSYKMALGLVFACDSNSGKSALFSNSPGGIWNGYSGTLYPLHPGYHVSNWIRSGQQGTK